MITDKMTLDERVELALYRAYAKSGVNSDTVHVRDLALTFIEELNYLDLLILDGDELNTPHISN